MFEAAAPATAAAAVTSAANSRCSPLPPRAQRCRPLLLLAKPAGGGQRTAREGVSPSPQLPPAVLVAAATAVAVAAAEAASMANATTAAVGVAAVTAVPLPRADCLPPPDRSPPHVVRPWMACIRWRGRADGRRALSAPPLPVLLVFLCGGRQRRGGGARGRTARGGRPPHTPRPLLLLPPPLSHRRRRVRTCAGWCCRWRRRRCHRCLCHSQPSRLTVLSHPPRLQLLAGPFCLVSPCSGWVGAGRHGGACVSQHRRYYRP